MVSPSRMLLVVMSVWVQHSTSQYLPGTLLMSHAGPGRDTVPFIAQYLVHSYLEGCGLTLLYDERDNSKDAEEILRQVDQPMTVFALEDSPDGGLELANRTEIPLFNTCSAYIILSQDPAGLGSLVRSEGFQTLLDYLGRFIFVTGSLARSPEIILDNEIMAWRPHALVVRKVIKTGEAGGDYEVWSHHMFREEDEETVYLAGRWRRGHMQPPTQLFPDKLDNFHGGELRAVTFEHAPSIVEVPGGSQGHHYDGIDIRLLYILSEALNFKLKIVNPSDGGKWGSPMVNGSWSGLTGDLTQRHAHMGVANLFIHIHYLEVVDMTVSYDMEFGCFITPLPEQLPQWMALVYPFSSQVWWLALVFLVVGTPLLYLTSRLTQYVLHDETPWATTLDHNLFYGTGIFFGVGMPQVPQSDVTRSYFIMWVWYGLLITVVYRSSLTAFLTIPLSQDPINTLQQLVGSSLPAWGATGLTFKKMLEENPDPMVQQLALRYQPVSGAEEGILLTAQRKYAMMENRQFLEYMIATNYTNKYGEETLHVMRECFLPFRIGMAMPKKAPYKPNFDKIVTRVVEAGLVRKWFSDILFMSRKRGSGEAQESRSDALTIDNLQGAWLLLGLGWVVSLVMFVLEVVLGPDRRG
ncbi:glutamate receptor ionotropic, kainate 4-like [Homarus americanus]|uniref:glutamate receptor ionotropic, kainate 4-like n=1 Tax=Homarus americanus TaxID=6706 RepID=UPI001C447436|nr:glutamate receptor ionotropic, kainate 4-like [Homarus americanus]